MADEIAIKVDGVSKDFILPHERVNSLKGIFTSLPKRKNKSEEVQHALRDINFEVKKGEFFGIVGRNGSGKSTLLKILAGIYQPTNGSIKVEGKLVPFIELGVGFNGELTGRENVFLNGAMLGFSVKEIEDMYQDIVGFAELERFMDQKLKNYSSGMQVRLAFSLATRAKAEVLLVDEVLAVGDAAFQRKCFEYFKELKAANKTVVFVTHDMNAVREYCDRAMLIDKSVMQRIGDPQDIARDYALLFMDNTEENRKTDGSRWGNGGVSFTSIKATVKDQDVLIHATAKVKKSVDQMLFGLHILGQDSKEITAMNNRMIQVPDLKGLKAGTEITFDWRVLNVFNDGLYYVSLTLVDDVGNTLDWFSRAATFTVKRVDRSTTSVLPPVTVTAELTGSN